MKNNLQPDVWGPSGWKFMHYVALGYPETPTDTDKENYRFFYESLGNVLPCQGCADHYKENVLLHPISDHLQSREDLLRWTFDIHNIVNEKNNKRQLTYEEALVLYTKKQFPVLDVIWKLLILIAITFVVYYVVK